MTPEDKIVVAFALGVVLASAVFGLIVRSLGDEIDRIKNPK